MRSVHGPAHHGRLVPCAIALIVVLLAASCSSEGVGTGSPGPAAGSTTGPTTTNPATGPTTEPTAAAPSVVTDSSAPAVARIMTTDGEVFDDARDRRIPYRIFSPSAVANGPAPVILVSHGGFGSDVAYRSGGFLGLTFAAHGFVAVHIGHLESATGSQQLDDRPADVTFVLDRLADGTIDVPDVDVDLDRVGHTGHSFGAYTAHAVGGATYARTHTDERIDAIAPISPQGPDQFGAFDRGPEDNTWVTVTIPSYNLIGGAEVDSNAIDSIERPGWRLVPFERYPGTADTLQTIIVDQDHADMWTTGSTEVQQFEARSIVDFFRRYVAADTTVDVCALGDADPAFAMTRRRPASAESPLGQCR